MLIEENIGILDGLNFDNLAKLWDPIRDVFGPDLRGPNPVGAERHYIFYKASTKTRKKLGEFATQFHEREPWAARGILLNGLVLEMEKERYVPDLSSRP